MSQSTSAQTASRKPTVMYAMRDDGDMTEPMNVMGLAARGEQVGWNSALLLLEGEGDDFIEKIKEVKPEVIAFSAITGSHRRLLEANRRIKEAVPWVKTVMGGPFATFRPNVIRDEPLDAVGIGECDDAWPELLQAWQLNHSPDAIPNIITKENENRVLQRHLFKGADQPWIIKPDHLRPRMTALDDLPFMNRALVYDNTKFKNRYKRTIMAGRGCPSRCTYCFEHAWNNMYKGKGKLLTRHSVERICEELAKLKRDYDTRFIKFYDDVFPAYDPLDNEWLEEFAELYPKKVGIPFHCLIRAEMATDRVLGLLKKAGIASLTMSIEGGNPFKRDYILLRDMSGSELTAAFKRCREHKIWSFANTIMGIPVPVRPSLDDPEFDQKTDAILDIIRDVKFRRHTPEGGTHLGTAIDELRKAGGSTPTTRIAIHSLMGAAGMRDARLDYDRDDIWCNVELGVSFGEFPVFFPYQGTQLGGYTVKQGYFDGDYDKLHSSYQTASPLNCFTEQEKLEQQNLALLGTIALLFSGSFNGLANRFAKPFTKFAVNVLAPLPLTHIYVRFYSWSKNYMHQTRVYPMKMSLRERASNLWDNLGLDLFKQVKKKRFGIFEFRGDRPGQTLGGPPSI